VDAESREIMPVVDPTVAPGTHRWLKRLIARKADPAGRLAIEYLGPFALVVCVLGALMTEMATPWLAAAAVSLVAVFVVNHEIVTGGLLRHRDHFVYPTDLDAACWRPLHTVQRTIDAVLRSEVYQAGLLAHAAQAADLRWHEWNVACRLFDITRLRAECTDSMSARPGPQTAAVPSAYLRAITITEDATARRIVELQRYADAVMAADLAMHDWRTAEQVAGGNQSLDALQAALDQAALVAQPLVLPAPRPHAVAGGRKSIGARWIAGYDR